jgi:hypothetical protein
LTDLHFAVKSGGMKRKSLFPDLIFFRPGAFAPVGDFFTLKESPGGSIFLPVARIAEYEGGFWGIYSRINFFDLKGGS